MHLERPGDFQPTDVVLGEFLGDQDRLVLDATGGALIAPPLDSREDWYRVAESLEVFLERYVTARGDKFWEE